MPYGWPHRDKAHIFFVATLSSDSDQLATFSQLVWQYTHNETDAAFTFPSWETAFKALADLPGRPIVIIDEITYLIAGNKAIPSILQKVWDAQLSRSNTLLILCGSYIRLIEREILDYQAALYGRHSGSELLLPLELPALTHFFPAASPSQLIEYWAVLGGMPYNLNLFSRQHELFDNIRTHILHPQGTLCNEPLLLLVEELRGPRNYFSILRAIAAGHTRLNAITQAAGVGDNSATGHDDKIDVVAIGDADKALLVGECKWSSKPVGLNILVDLQRKAKVLQGEGAWQITYAIFAKSGFTPDLMALAQTEGILLVGSTELVGE